MSIRDFMPDSTFSREYAYNLILFFLNKKLVAYLDKVKTYEKESAAQTERYELCAGRVTKLEEQVTTLAEKNRKLKNLAKGLGGGLVASIGTLVLLISLK